MHRVSLTYKDHWKEVEVLPKCLQEELYIHFLKCDEILFESDEEELFDWPCSFTPQDFVNLSKVVNYEYAFHDVNHLIFDYCSIIKDNTRIRCCESCLIEMKIYYETYCMNNIVDAENEWSFWHCTEHKTVSLENMKNFIKNAYNFCHICKYGNLIKYVLDRSECRSIFNYHRYIHRRYERYDESSDDEYDDEFWDDMASIHMSSLNGWFAKPEARMLNKRF